MRVMYSSRNAKRWSRKKSRAMRPDSRATSHCIPTLLSTLEDNSVLVRLIFERWR